MRLLIVEDDQDGREMLTELFRMNAWQVTPVESTRAAMVELRAGGFDVVISDEDLAGASGSAMLREASEAGLLRDVGALMYTAEPGDLELPPGVRVLKKPLGIAQLVNEVTAALAEVPGSGEPLALADDPIPIAPVLVKNCPGAQGRFVGHLDSARSLAALSHDLESACPPSSHAR